jgi:hypothetical protein
MMDFHDQRQNLRLEALERRVAAIFEHLGLEDPVPVAPADVSPRVAELARAGRTLEAIRTHVRETGANLATARDAVAAIA